MFFVALGGTVTIAGFAGTWYFGTGHETKSTLEVVSFALLSLLFSLVGAYLALTLITFKLALRADSLEMTTCFSRKTMRREEISGFRIQPTQYVPTLVLEPNQKSGKRLKIPMFMKVDPALENWFVSLRNLNVEDRASEKARLAADPDLGLTPQQRLESLDAGKRIAKPANAAALALSLWGLFLPRPHGLVVVALISIPLVTIWLLLRSPGVFQVEGRPSDPRPSLALPLILPELVLALFAIREVYLVDWKVMSLVACVAGGLFAITVASVDRRTKDRPWALILFLLFGAAYGYGTLAQLDRSLDRSVPQTYEVAVQGKIYSASRRPDFRLVVDRWGPRRGFNTVNVPRSVYESVAPGETVCVRVSSGALRIPWYLVSSCTE